MIKIAIIDDLYSDIEIISNYIHTYFIAHYTHLPFSIETFENGEDFLETFQPYSYDIVFMDYYMNDLSRLNTASAIRQSDHCVKIIFTTSSRDFAVESYNVQASGYLVKPISYEDFATTLSRIDFNQIKKHQFIQITSGYETFKIPLNHILYCDVSGHYVQIHTKTTKIQRTRMAFAKIKELLTPYAEFLPCYRGCIINMNHVDHIEDSVFILDNGEPVPFSKRQHRKILKLYTDYLFDKVRNEA